MSKSMTGIQAHAPSKLKEVQPTTQSQPNEAHLPLPNRT